jgi:AAA15 family ATPase/GTPase
MRFSLTNIGKIAQADIEINGLTVLGGYNDIGKSTIGKMIFSIVKSISNAEQAVTEEKIEQVGEEITVFYMQIRKMTGTRFGLPSVVDGEQGKIKRQVHLFEKIAYSVDTMRKGLRFMLGEQQDIRENLTLHLGRIREELRLVNASDMFVSAEDDVVIIELDNLLNLLENRIAEIFNPEKNESYKKTFNYVNQSLFRGDIQNVNASTNESKVSSADGYCKIDTVLENGNAKSFSIEGDFPFRDVTLVDSPLVLGWSPFVLGWSSPVRVSRNRAKSIFGYYVFDLLNKIQYSTLDSYSAVSDIQKEFVNKIDRIIGGQMYYDRKEKDFVFKQEKMTVKPVNIASGIKTFGIIQMLLTSGTIVANTVLIIDEPEAHLHPEWQLKYAEVITQLVDMGVYVLVSTHSPYMIEALKHYSEKLEQEKITNFYLGSAGEHGTVFSDVTQDLNPLFELLAKPMRKLL